MASSPDHISMALFCDFENVALGVRDANYDKFDIKRVLERLLLKGSIVVKKSYCDWERYKGFKAAMHEANFELIEIPHVRQSGKNSADIRLVVDALDLCYTKSHVNTFVIISGDSDFSPLVSKLRENAKYVIGVGVKQSTSDLLIANCDEFIFYDDLVRESQRQAARRDNREPQQARRTPEEEARRREELDARRTKAVEMAAETYEALVTDRDEGGRIWASVLKEAIKRRNPGFNENYYGFRTFGNLLEEARARGLLEFGRDEKSSAFVFRSSGGMTPRTEMASAPEPLPQEAEGEQADAPRSESSGQARHDERSERGERGERGEGRRRGRGGRASSARAGKETDGSTRQAEQQGARQPRGGRPQPRQDQATQNSPASSSAPSSNPAEHQAEQRNRRQEAHSAAPAPLPPVAAPVPAPAPETVSAPAAQVSGEAKPRKAAAKRAPRKTAASTTIGTSPTSSDAPTKARRATATEAAASDAGAATPARKTSTRARRPRKAGDAPA